MYPALHIHDGRLISLDYNTLNVQEIIEYDEQWDEDKEPTRNFAIHDKFDDFYWVSEHYAGNSRRTAENTVSHGHVLMCGSEVIAELKDEQQGKDIIRSLAVQIATDKDNTRIFFLNEDLTISTMPK